MRRVSIPLDPTLRGRDAISFTSDLRSLVVGQEEAVEQIANLYQMFLVGMNAPGRPLGNVLILGPTGSGKTRIVEATAEVLYKKPRTVIKIDCAEFQHSHDIAKLVGSPPGYMGHRETHAMLLQEIIDQHHTDTMKVSIVLFDEIEKASSEFFNLLLGILDKATLTLGNNRKVDFSKAMIFMTSNLGAAQIDAALSRAFGFKACISSAGDLVSELKKRSRLARLGEEAARRKFTPEFFNRFDKILAFRQLNVEQLRQVLDIELKFVHKRISLLVADRVFSFDISQKFKDLLLYEGTDTRYGARHLKRAIERRLVQPLSALIATEQIRGGNFIQVDFDPVAGEAKFTRVAEGVRRGLTFEQLMVTKTRTMAAGKLSD